MNFSGIDSVNLIGRLLRWPLRLIPRETILPILQGKLRGRKWISGSSNHGCWLGSYEFDKQKFMTKTVHAGTVAYDIGANVGFYTLLFSVLVGDQGSAVAFEPVLSNVAFIQRHLQLNHRRNVQVYQVALGQTTGEALLELGVNNSMARLSATGSVRVPLYRLDDWRQQFQARPPTYLKIDVEGAEAEVLDGARLTLIEYRPAIFLATHGLGVHRRCLAILGELGYQLQSLTSASIDVTDEVFAF